jgi:hypothetical protein
LNLNNIITLGYWEEETLEGIGNTLGSFIKVFEITIKGKYTSYTRLCAYINVSQALPHSIFLRYQENEWLQSIDYENISFGCHKCHEHGHLFRDFPLNKQQPMSKENTTRDAKGFETMTTKRRHNKKPIAPLNQPKITTTEKFDTL